MMARQMGTVIAYRMQESCTQDNLQIKGLATCIYTLGEVEVKARNINKALCYSLVLHIRSREQFRE